MRPDVINVDNIRKVIRRRGNVDRGTVQYIYDARNPITKTMVDALCEEIRKTFPNVTDDRIEVKSGKWNCLELSFYCENLPKKYAMGFEEEDINNDCCSSDYFND